MGGATALRGEALREALPDFYAQAVTDTEVDPIDQPEIDITSGDESGPVSFDAVVLVRPTVGIPGYQGLVVTLPEPRGLRGGDHRPDRPPPGARRASWWRCPARPRTATR